MTGLPSAAEERYARLTQAFLGRPDVTRAGEGFGSTALKIGGRIFAMLSSKGEFVVKLPRQRVDALVTSGDGERYQPRPGRVMKEWLALRADSPLDWASLAEEARAFVAGSNRIAGSNREKRRSST